MAKQLAETFGKPKTVARDDASQGVADRRHPRTANRASLLDADKFASVVDPCSAISLRLKASWTQGGRERGVPVATDDQRVVPGP